MKINGTNVAGLIVDGYPRLTKPVKKKVIIDVPGADGSIDMSTALTNGEPVYENRTLEVRCLEVADDPSAAFEARVAAWHGRELDITPDSRPGHYHAIDVDLSTFGFHGKRFGYTLIATVQPWRWNDETTKVVKTATSAGVAFTLAPSRMIVVPRITCVNAVTVVVGSRQITVPAGSAAAKLYDLKLFPGVPISGTIKGSGSVTIETDGGKLI